MYDTEEVYSKYYTLDRTQYFYIELGLYQVHIYGFYVTDDFGNAVRVA